MGLLALLWDWLLRHPIAIRPEDQAENTWRTRMLFNLVIWIGIVLLVAGLWKKAP